MFTKFITFLKFEEQLVSELVRLSERQQKALVNNNIKELEEITSYQVELQKNLRKAEDQRMTILATWLNINRSMAASLKLSDLAKYLKKNEMKELIIVQNNFENLIARLMNLNTINRVLLNRARNGIREMLDFLTNGTQNVCNIRI